MSIKIVHLYGNRNNNNNMKKNAEAKQKFCVQSFKASMVVNYESRVVSISNLLVITSLES